MLFRSNDTATTEIYTLSDTLSPHDALPISSTSGDNVIANTGAEGSHVTDLTYVRLSGTDFVPEMYYGRFSVSSATELTNIINKTLTWERLR